MSKSKFALPSFYSKWDKQNKLNWRKNKSHLEEVDNGDSFHS